MKLTFIGSGAAFTNNNYHSNILIELNNKKLLIDCGSDARFSLGDLNYSFKDIDTVYISHIHADHVGGLEWLGFCRKFTPGSTRPNIIAHKNILDNLWEHCLSAGMKTLDAEEAALSTFFNPQALSYPSAFKWEGVDFNLVKTLHIKNNNKVLDSYGLLFEVNNTKIFLTTDTRLVLDEFTPHYETADLIFHDCETQPQSGVHTHYTELLTLPADIKSKTWLYHYNSGELPNAVADGFKGFIKKGQVFSF